MAKVTLLFVDNNSDFLTHRKEFLERADYRVLTATSIEEARQILNVEHVDLVILDVRMENDNDPQDRSGLVFAREIDCSIAKIILTQFPSYEDVRAVMLPPSVAVDYLHKEDGPEKLLESVRTIFRRNVFIVHGHDENARNATELFIKKLDLHPIVLRDLPNGGRAILDKFEDATSVAFVIVLLTPDDRGGTMGTPAAKLRPRARQNVIFELGYFTDKLGRRNVVALFTDDIEKPSDYDGVLCIHMDPGQHWKASLAKEMKYAGIEFDVNKIL